MKLIIGIGVVAVIAFMREFGKYIDDVCQSDDVIDMNERDE